MLGVIVTLVMFLLITSKTRGMILGGLFAFGEWVGAYAPFSYLVVLLILAAPVVSWHMVARGPKVQEPEDPMRKYRNADDVLPD